MINIDPPPPLLRSLERRKILRSKVLWRQDGLERSKRVTTNLPPQAVAPSAKVFMSSILLIVLRESCWSYPPWPQANNLQRAGITVDHHLESRSFFLHHLIVESGLRVYKKHLKEILDGHALLKHPPVKVGSQPCFLFLPLGWKTALTCMLYAYSFLIKGNDR